MSNELQTAFNEISQLRELPSEIVLDALQTALVSAFRKDTGASAAQAIEAEIDPTTGRAKVFVEKEVVDEVYSDATEVELELARATYPAVELNDVVMVQVEHNTSTFGRIAAQTAKQVILQKIREAERSALYDEFINREGDLMIGTVQSTNSRKVTLSLGRAEADLPRSQQIPGERYRTHEKIRVYVVEVSKSSRGPQILVSRAHREMLHRLLEYEVPEIYNGQVEVKKIAREAGHRSKVAVAALQDGIDPVGACVGMRGIRIQNIVKELHNEKIDVIEWNPDAVQFITKALSPARVVGVFLDNDPAEGKTAIVLVPDDQLSLAIGREGQNARLAAKLTGWRIDIKSVLETVQTALDNLDAPPLASWSAPHSDLAAESLRIIEKRRLELAVMPEEFKTLERFASLVEGHMQEARDSAHAVFIDRRDKVRETLAPTLFELPLDVLAVSQDVLDVLEPYENIGEVMLLHLIDESLITRKFADIEGEPVAELQNALDAIMAADLDQLLAEAISIEEVEDEAAAELADEEPEQAEAQAEAAAEEEVAEADPADVVLDAFGQPIVPEEAEPVEEVVVPEVIIPVPGEMPEAADQRRELREERPASAPFGEEDSEKEFELELRKGKTQRRKDRQKRRQLVLDEASGEVIAKRRRKSSRGGWDEETWEDYDY